MKRLCMSEIKWLWEIWRKLIVLRGDILMILYWFNGKFKAIILYFVDFYGLYRCFLLFWCSFYIALSVRIYFLIWINKKWLSVKVLINKDVFGIAGRFLVEWGFDFWVGRWVKCLILVGFDDMGYDKRFEIGNLGFCLILLEILKVLKLSECVE